MAGRRGKGVGEGVCAGAVAEAEVGDLEGLGRGELRGSDSPVAKPQMKSLGSFVGGE